MQYKIVIALLSRKESFTVQEGLDQPPSPTFLKAGYTLSGFVSGEICWLQRELME